MRTSHKLNEMEPYLLLYEYNETRQYLDLTIKCNDKGSAHSAHKDDGIQYESGATHVLVVTIQGQAQNEEEGF